MSKAIPSYTGIGLDAPEAKQIDAGFYYPLEGNWSRDQEITCYVGPVDGNPSVEVVQGRIVGSAKVRSHHPAAYL